MENNFADAKNTEEKFIISKAFCGIYSYKYRRKVVLTPWIK
jgi:hypothetical protein